MLIFYHACVVVTFAPAELRAVTRVTVHASLVRAAFGAACCNEATFHFFVLHSDFRWYPSMAFGLPVNQRFDVYDTKKYKNY